MSKSNLPKGPLSVLRSENPSCGPWGIGDRLRYWKWNYFPEWSAWFHISVLRQSYDVEYIMNGTSLGSDFQLTRRGAIERARSFSYAYSWALLASKVTDKNGAVVFDTVVRQATAAEIREHAENDFPSREGLEYRALMEYAERLEAQEAETNVGVEKA